MNDAKQRAAAKKFADDWKGKGYEKGESQPYWLSLLRDVLGVEHPEAFISFEDQVHLDHTSFIDGTIAATRVLIEQKGLGKDLKKPIRQSDGSLLTPFQQAKRYVLELPLSQHPRWIVTCNFSRFHVYDMEKPNGEPEEILLEKLPEEYYRLKFLVDTGDINIKKEMEVSIQAGELVGLLYDAFMKEYKDPTNVNTLRSLNMLCVRIVFCLYAEDAGIFGRHGMFHDYMKNAGVRNARRALIDLFRVLDTEEDKRDPYMDAELAAFPYVNGGLFNEENIEIPQFTPDILELLLSRASEDFNWSQISPTIFGAVFESTLNPETRRSGGMHYTSIQNIHKLIDPLFLNELKGELTDIKGIAVERTRTARLKAYQKKLAELTFLDPACGSGNFLTETYICLRRLENEVITVLYKGQISMGIVIDPIQVSIGQFYGIEINDFAVTVAKTALWIAESQMMKETEDVVHMNLDFLPLKSYANIVEGNALRIDWEDVVSKDRLNYIMGNPPFVGYSLQSKSQKEDILSIYKDEKGKNYNSAGKIDYVAGWYFKAANIMKDTLIRTAFVSTNSITQGEQVAGVWKPLYDRFNVHIDFAHRTFRWDSEASMKAHVHCVIVGFSAKYSLLMNKTQRQYEDFFNLPYSADLQSRARELRKAGNLSEVKVWNRLKNKQMIGLDFDRQKVIGSYIVDFYNANNRTVIEIDGYSHSFKQEHDEERESYLKGLGLSIIHVEAKDVLNDVDKVISMLENYFCSIRNDHPVSSLRSLPPLHGGEGRSNAHIQQSVVQQSVVQQSVVQQSVVQQSGSMMPFPSVEGWQRAKRADGVVVTLPHINGVVVSPVIYDNGKVIKAQNINPYLIDAPNFFIENRFQPLCMAPTMIRGCQATDGGNLILNEEEYKELIAKEPLAAKYIKRFNMGEEFIKGIKRYCLWLVNCPPNELKKMPLVMKRVKLVYEMRISSKKEATRKKAQTPMLFDEIKIPSSDNYIAIPKVSSERRKYIPMGYLNKDTIAGDKIFILSEANMYHFGILTSNVHMAWMRTVSGRLEMRYSYSNTIVYNNFAWPTPTAPQRAHIEKTAQAILDARALYPDCSLADLYDEATMPPELRKAHQLNDRAVMEAYGFNVKETTESSCVAALMQMYQALTAR